MTDHDEIQSVLNHLGCDLTAPFVHGTLCGLVWQQTPSKAKTAWFKELLQSAGVNPGSLTEHAEGLKLLDKLFETTLSELNSADMEFDLLLPDDRTNIDERVLALANWCKQFCACMGVSNEAEIQKLESLTSDTQELLTDFQKISEINADHAESDEDSFTELAEYVRMGTMFIMEELQPAPVTSQRLH